MFADSRLHYATITEQADLVRSKNISPVELTRIYLDRIQQLNPCLASFITVLDDRVIQESKQAECDILAGNYNGPLHGIPIALKDIIHVKGVRTTAGSRVLGKFLSDHDSTIVKRLRDSGAVILGKTNLSEFAMGGTVNHPFGTPRNPWDFARTPGASSSGSGVAVATGLCSAALGTDTGGSIRGPAFCCGIVGIRPTYGRVTRHGVVSMCWSMDTVGPLARTVRDCAIVLQSIAGRDSRDVSTSQSKVPNYSEIIEHGIEGMKIGVPREMFEFEGLDSEIRAIVIETFRVFEDLGASFHELSLPLVQDSSTTFIAVADTDAAAFHSRWMTDKINEYDWNTRSRLESAHLVPAHVYIQAQRMRTMIRLEMLEALNTYDILIAPSGNEIAQILNNTTGQPGGDYHMNKDLVRRRLMSSVALAGLPALSVPCGFSKSGMPVGLQLIGRPFEESTLFNAGFAYETSTNWHNCHPNL